MSKILESGWCEMKRNKIRRFFQQKQYAIASLVLFAAIAAMTGVYFSNKITGEKAEKEIAKQEQDLVSSEEQKKNQYEVVENSGSNTKDKDKEDVTSVTSVIQPKDTDTNTDDQTNSNTDNAAQELNDSKDNQTQEEQTAEDDQSQQTTQQEDDTQKQDTTTNAKVEKTLHFTPETDLGWPLEGDVLLNYSMDQTVYFATLDQYKYNPAIIIAGKVNDTVRAAATGRITKIATNEETGTTVTMDLGDGYTAVYGQLKEVLYNKGAVVEAGNAIGYIAEPTKYYSVEGSNLYFELRKDDEPVNPMQYIE